MSRGVYIKRNFRWYEVISREMLRVMKEHSPQVEYYSIDEFFLTVEAREPTADLAVQWAWAIRNLERLIEALEHMGLQAGKLTLILEYKNGPTRSAETSLGAPTDRFDLLHQAACSLWQQPALIRPYCSHRASKRSD